MMYNEFVKRYTARLESQYIRPPMTAKGKLQLPFNSVYHFLDPDRNPAFGQEDDVFITHKGTITVENVLDLAESARFGKLKFLTYSKPTVNTEFYKRHREFEKFSTAQSRLGNTPKLLHVVNYGMLTDHVKQLDEPQAEYHAYLNYWTTVFSTMAQKVATDKRYHFVRLPTAIIIPPKSILEKVEAIESMTITQLGYFIDEVQLMVLDFWRFLSMDRPEVTNLSLIRLIPEEHLSRIHFIYDVGQFSAVINLGKLVSWIKTATNPDGKYTPEDIKRRFLKQLISFADLRTQTTSPDDEIDGDLLDDQDDILEGLDEDSLTDVNQDDNDDYNPTAAHSKNIIETTVDKKTREEFARAESKKPKGGFYKQVDQSQSDYSSQNLSNSIRELLKSDDMDEFLDDTALQDRLETHLDGKDEDITDEELSQLESTQEQVLKDRSIGEYSVYQPEPLTYGKAIDNKVKMLSAAGMLTSGQVKRFDKLSQSYKDIKSADTGERFETFLKIDPKDTKISNQSEIIKPTTSVLDDSFRYSSLRQFDQVYIEKFMEKHIALMTVSAMQKEGIVVKDIKRTHVKTLDDDYYQYSVKVIPVVGQESTFSFKLPRVKPDGTFLVGGTKAHMRKQRSDLIIRKTGPDEVAMTSYHSKLFLSRASRVTASYEKWLCSQVIKGLETNNVSDVVYGKGFNPDIRTPRAYSALGMSYLEFKAGLKGEYHFILDQAKIDQSIAGEHKVRKGEVICGVMNKLPMVMDEFGIVSLVKGEGHQVIGTVESMIGVASDVRPPRDMLELGPVAGQKVPLGVLLGYYVGLGNLLKTLNVQHRLVNKGARITLEANEFAIRFSDQTLIVKDTDRINTAILNGFNRYHGQIINFGVWEFDKKDAYHSVLEEHGINTRGQTKITQLRNHWVDPIAHDILIEMGYPTDFVLLLIKAAELLEYDDHPDENDIRHSRDRGYERFSGLLYGEIMAGLTDFNSRPNNPNAKFSINPESVWFAVTTDQSTAPVDDSNPLHSIKERSVVIFSGAGGRSGQTMTAKSRRFHKSGIGVVSEATVDSGDVGTITYLTANPNYTSIYGTSTDLENPNEKAANCFSDVALTIPGGKYDD